MPISIRADLFFGAAYGLATSVVIWTLVLATPTADATTMLLIGAGALVGAALPRLRPLRRLEPAYAVILAALIVQGPTTSILVALVAAATGQAGRRATANGAQRAIDISGGVLASAIAAAAFVAGGSVGAPAILIHVALFLATRVLIDRWAGQLSGRCSPTGAARRALGRGLPAAAAAVALGLTFAWALAAPGQEVLVASALLLASTLPLYVSRRRERRTARTRSSTVARVSQSTLDSLVQLVTSRDDHSRDHLHRVRRLCLAVGERIGLARNELRALDAAALLHDLGKLAIPERILSKPGKLNSLEMARIRTHPVIGADVLERIPGRADLAAIVRHHHEKWDGTGYPARLAGERIPLAARILSAADNYDALTTDRPYRTALPHADAVDYLRREIDAMFDAQVVEALIEILEEHPGWVADAETDRFVSEEVEERGSAAKGELPLAQVELQKLYEIGRARKQELDPREFLTLAGCKLEFLVPHRALVVYRLDEESRLLRAVFATGPAADRLQLITIPLGERLSGWTAMQRETHSGCTHRSPVDRDGYRSDLEDWFHDAELHELDSALATPLVEDDRCVGTLTVYDHGDRRFTEGEQRTLARFASRLAWAVKGDAPGGDLSLTDPSTGVANGRFLWLEASQRIVRAEQASGRFGLLAFRVLGVGRVTEQHGPDVSERMVGRVARRFAAARDESDAVVRFGPDLFVVLTSARESSELVARWHALALEIEQPMAITPHGPIHHVRLCAAHAIFPENGETVEALLEFLDDQLAGSGKSRNVVPFRARAAAPLI